MILSKPMQAALSRTNERLLTLVLDKFVMEILQFEFYHTPTQILSAVCYNNSKRRFDASWMQQVIVWQTHKIKIT